MTTQDGADVSAPPDTGQITLTLEEQVPTNGDDSLLWTGDVIDGLDGEDTVSLRPGDSLTGADLMAGLENIETLDMGVNGVNTITQLSAQNVRFMTDSDNALTINGTSADQLELNSDWTDNGDGTYSATVTQGAITTQVNLAVAGGVIVSQSAGGGGGAPGLSAPPQRLGLDALDSLSAPEPKAEKGGVDGLTLGDVLHSASGSMAGGLLGDTADAGHAPVASAQADAWSAAEPVSPLDDDLSDTLVSEF